MFGWFQALMPREERFFDLFTRHATIVVAGAEALRGLLQGGDGIEGYCKQIFEREAEADEITRQVLTAVRRTFVTPFDRTDIQDLISSMDDSIDQMNKTAKIIDLFEVRSFEPQMREMGDIIVQAANLVLEAVPLLSAIASMARWDSEPLPIEPKSYLPGSRFKSATRSATLLTPRPGLTASTLGMVTSCVTTTMSVFGS